MKNNLHIHSIKTTVLSHLFMVLMGFFLFTGSLSATISTDCSVAFEYGDYVGACTDLGGLTFYNLSVGEYTQVEWNFGDGMTSNAMTDTVSHFYTQNGNYVVTLSVWTVGEECFSKGERTISINSIEEDCSVSDCVFPGNANGDGKADLYDLLNIGMGFGTVGQPRPNASYDWFGQPAPDWEQETADGINYKHLDCNGDGIINEGDLTPILYNYSSMDIETMNVQVDAPKVYLQFNYDTIYINDNSPETITVSAVLQIGEENQPVENIYGLAAHMSYDTAAVQTIIGIHPEPNSFLGLPDAVLPYGRNLRDNQQIDFAVSRKAGGSVSGYGRLARIEFVIIVDIIGGRVEKDAVVDFRVPIDGFVAIGQNGEPINIALDDEAAKIVFVLEEGLNVLDTDLDQLVKVFPNPATTELNIDLGELKGTQVDLFDMLGRQVKSEQMQGHQYQIQTGDLNKGVYMLSVETDKGTMNRRVIIE